MVAARDVFRQIVFAWLTGNGDVHAKNMSVLGDATTGEWRVAPAYDLPSTLPYRDFTMALSVGGKREGLSRRSLSEFAERAGLPVRAASRVLDDVLDATEGVIPDVESGVVSLPPQSVRPWVRGLRSRRKGLA